MDTLISTGLAAFVFGGAQTSGYGADMKNLLPIIAAPRVATTTTPAAPATTATPTGTISAALTAIVTALLLTLPTATHASKLDCKDYYEFGEALMSARQSDVPMPTIMEAVEDSALLEQYVIMAYDFPVFQTQKARERSISEFANLVYSNCMKATSKGNRNGMQSL